MAEETGYLGNPLLKEINTPIEWTKDQLEEYIKCKNDIIYFSEKYIKIVHIDRGLIPIVLYPFQKEIIKKAAKNRKLIANLPRQSGKTTTATCIILHYILFNNYKNVGILANKFETAREILNRIKTAYEALPKWMQQGIKVWNKGSIELENGCCVIASATSGSAGRSKSLAFVYIDETAWVENWDDFYASVYPTISSGKESRLIMTSTPKGLNHWYYFCKGAEEGINGFAYVSATWRDVPGRDEEWKKDALASLNYDQQKFDQEFECEFLGSSGTLINGASLKLLKPVLPVHEEYSLSVYENPIKNKKYVIVVDVSHGKGLDYSVFQVIDISQMPYKQVAVFRNNEIPPIEFCEKIFQIAKVYNEAELLVENNDLGRQVADSLHYDFEANVLCTENHGKTGKRIFAGYKNGVEWGIRTTKTVKAIGCSILKLLIEHNKLIIVDENTISELSTFSKKGNSYEAESGKHDDLVMCLVLFAWLSDQNYFRENTDIDTLATIREKTDEQLKEELLPFGFNNNDFDEYGNEKPNDGFNDYEKIGYW